MKNKYYLVGLFLLLAGFAAFTISCGMQKVSENYYVSVDSLGNTGEKITYVLLVTNASSETGYVVNAATTTESLVLRSKCTYTNNPTYMLPRITYNTINVVYTVDLDTNNILGSWRPSPFTSGISILIPRGSQEASTTLSMNNLTPWSNINEVNNKIVTVEVTPIDPLAVPLYYNFVLSLKTGLIVRADVTLTGSDEYGAAVTTKFSTNVSYGM